MKTCLNIAATDVDTVKVLADTVLQVLNAPHTDEKTKQLALKVLNKGVTAPSNIHVNNCHMNMPDTTNNYYNEEE